MGLATIDGLTIHYHTAGDLSAPRGRRILYIHGTGCDGRVWARHMAALADRYASVAIDLPGHGRSEGDGFRGVADYASCVARLLAHLEWDHCVVAGHSLGGGIALALAVYHTEPLDGLLLVDTGARLRVDPTILENARRAVEGGPPLPLDPRLGYATSTPQSVIDGIEALTADTDPRVTYKDWISDDSFDFMSRVSGIHVPSLAICGDEDRFTPVKYHVYLRDRMPNCQLAVIRRAGHWTYAEQPQVFDRVVRSYLDSLPPQRPE